MPKTEVIDRLERAGLIPLNTTEIWVQVADNTVKVTTESIHPRATFERFVGQKLETNMNAKVWERR